jgi:hypothetical protein
MYKILCHLLCFLVVYFPLRALADTETYLPGELRTYSTISSIGIEWDVTGDSNHNAACNTKYRVKGGGSWKDALSLFRVDYNGYNMFAGSVLFLDAETTYEINLDIFDPDGGSNSRTIEVTTRPMPSLPTSGNIYHVEPGSGGGDGSGANPFRGISTAQLAAQPGDIFLLHKGDYGGSRINLNKSGEASNYIVWKAVGDGDVIFHGVDIAADHVWLEGTNQVASGNSLLTSNAPEDVVIVRNTFVNCHYCIYLSGGGRNWYIADNTITGDTPPGTDSFSGEGIELMHTSGHVVAYNRISHVADGISYPHTNVDIHGNDIFDVGDDGIEPDYGYANNRIWGNRIHNAVNNGISFQPMNSAPWYIIRNQVVAGYNALKLRTGDRVLLANNTLVGWLRVETIGVEQLLGFRSNNNLWISVTGNYLWENGNGGSAGWRTQLDYDGFNDLDGSGDKFKWGGRRYTSLVAFQRDTGLELNGTSLSIADSFETFNVNQPPASTPPHFMTLKTDCNAIDAGVVLPNINDHFTGSAPDLGSYESGLPLPHYGPRPLVQEPQPPRHLRIVR